MKGKEHKAKHGCGIQDVYNYKQIWQMCWRKGAIFQEMQCDNWDIRKLMSVKRYE